MADTPEAQGVTDVPGSGAGAARLVASAAALNVLSFVDRQLLVALAPLLIADLGLSRAQIGLLVGIAFMLIYAGGTLVVGIWADRWPRPRLIAAGLAIWSLGTALTSAAGSMATLAACRGLVGAGEAALPATALSMVGDRVPARRLGLASGVFYAGVPVGYAISLAVAGWLAPRLGWRACFLLLGLAGLAGTLLVLRMADAPRRGSAVARAGRPKALWPALRERPEILLLTLAGVLLVYTSASSQHAITWLVAERGFEYSRAAFASAGVILTAGLTGNVVIGIVTDRARRAHIAHRLFALAGVSAVGLIASLGFYSLPPSSWAFGACWFVGQGYLLGWYGALVAAVDERAAPGQRGATIGFLLLFVNLVGVAAGAFVTGLVADRSSLSTALRWSVLPGAAGALLLAITGARERRAPSDA